MLEKQIESTLCWTMSLSSKELFHSNFLWYVAVKHRDFFLDIMEQCGIKTICSKSNVNRELKNTDLLFKCDYSTKDFGKENICAIIENKVKSIPELQQLASYSKFGGQDTQYLLLTMINPFNSGRQIAGAKDWIIVTYLEFSKHYNDALTRYSYSDKGSLDYLILKDYGLFIEYLANYIDSYRIKKFESAHIVDLFEAKIMQNNLRLHDLIFKLKYSQFALELEQKLQSKDAKVSRDWGQTTNEIYVGISYQMSGPLVELRKRVDNDWFYQLQIQNDVLQRYIVTEKLRGEKDYNKKLQAWNSFNTNSQNQIITNLLNSQDFIKPKEKEFYSFNEFLCRKWAIKKNETLDKLMDDMVAEIIGLP